jgi:hypothetical protein
MSPPQLGRGLKSTLEHPAVLRTDGRQLVHWSDTGIWEMTLVKFFPFTNDGMDLRKAPDGGPSTLN